MLLRSIDSLQLHVIIGCSFVLYCYNSFASIHKRIDFFSYFPLLYTQCLIKCVCVCVCKKVLLLCSVMSAVPVPSKNCLEKLDDFRHSGVL